MAANEDLPLRESLVSVALSDESLRKLGDLSLVDGMPVGEEIRQAAGEELARVLAAELTVEEVVAAGERDLAVHRQLVSVLIPNNLKDTAAEQGFIMHDLPSLAPLIRAGVAARVQRCEEPDFADELESAKAENAEWVRTYINRWAL